MHTFTNHVYSYTHPPTPTQTLGLLIHSHPRTQYTPTPYPVVDTESLEGRFCYIITHKAHAENMKLHPLLIKTTLFFDRFGEQLLALPVHRSVFDRHFC